MNPGLAESVPIIDLSRDESEVAAQVRTACLEHGFFYISNHQVPADIIQRFFDLQAKFFALTLENKLKIAPDHNNRGYTPCGDETLDPQHSKNPDTHEGLYFGREVDPNSSEAELPLHGPNQWPSEEEHLDLAGYKEVTNAYMKAVTDLGFRLLRVIALSLNLPAEHFDSAFKRPMTFLRPLRYTAELSDIGEGKYAAGGEYWFLLLSFVFISFNTSQQYLMFFKYTNCSA